MRVLAIDPGYGRCGIAILERQGPKDVLLFSDCIETSAHDEFADRLAAIASACRATAVTHAPDCVALEKLFVTKNQKTAMRVAEVRGAIIAIAGELGMSVHEYSPSEVKAAAAGFGSADKAQVIKMVRALVKIERPIRLDDEYDAIAVGVTHLAMHPARALRALQNRAKQR